MFFFGNISQVHSSCCEMAMSLMKELSFLDEFMQPVFFIAQFRGL